jgi:hypothetical protein
MVSLCCLDGADICLCSHLAAIPDYPIDVHRGPLQVLYSPRLERSLPWLVPAYVGGTLA